MTAAIDLTPKQRETLRALLHRFIPGVAVWAFGSRVEWNARPDSDLDLAVFSSPKQQRRVSALKEALAESDLPFLVDLHVWDELPQRFQEVIRKEYVVIQEAEKAEDRLEVPTEWRRTALGEAAELLSGGTPSKGRPEYWGGTIPWVSAKDMKWFRLEDTEDHLTEAGAANAARIVPAGTVLVLARGMTLLNDVPICVVGKPMAFNQDVKALQPKPGVTPDYLPYLLLGTKDRLFSLVDLAGHGTGRLNSDELKALDVVLPPIEEQTAIAHILGMLDDKIELGWRMNRTLEELAQALFRAWFVDFQGETDLVESELGPIPRAWEVGGLEEIAKFLNGVACQRYPANNEEDVLRVIKIRELRSGFAESSDVVSQEELPSQYEVKDGDILFSWSGSLEVKIWSEGPGALNQHIFKVTPIAVPRWFVYFWLLEFLPEFRHIAASKATTMGHIRRRHLQEARLPVPPKSVLDRADGVVGPLLERFLLNEHQSRTLADLRDTLLPKLISGEIRVPEAEEVVGEAV